MRIYGTIRDSKNRNLVKGANIKLSIEGSQIAAVASDEQGQYEYESKEEYLGQTLDFTIEKEGFSRKNISYEIDKSEIKSDFLMDEHEITIKGKICDETDSPLDNTSIKFTIGNSTKDLVSGKDGSFSFTIEQQFLDQKIKYEANKEGFKIKNGNLTLTEELQSINLFKETSPETDKKNWTRIAIVGIVLTSIAIIIFALPGILDKISNDDQPKLLIDPNPIVLEFNPDSGPQIFKISNDGGGTLDWEVYADKDWITATPSSGTNSNTVIISIDNTNLSTDIHTGYITITSKGGTEIGRISLDISDKEVQAQAVTPEITPEVTLKIPEIIYFFADNNTISAGEKTILQWRVSDATKVTINDNIGEVELFDKIEISPDKNITYELKAENEDGISDFATFTVNIGSVSVIVPKINSFYVDKPNITYGNTTTLHWDVSNAERINISNINDGNINLIGQKTITPNESTCYILTAFNEANERFTKHVEVTVEKYKRRRFQVIDDSDLDTYYKCNYSNETKLYPILTNVTTQENLSYPNIRNQ